MAFGKPTPRFCLQHNRFLRKDGWQLHDMSLSLHGGIAVSGVNIHTLLTLIDVYSFGNFDPMKSPKLIYSKEFEKYVSKGRVHIVRRVSFLDPHDNIVTCIGDKLEVIELSTDEVLRSIRLKGAAFCMSVKEREIFIAYKESNTITVHNVTDLSELRSVMLEGVQNGDWPQDITAVAYGIFSSIRSEIDYHRFLVFEETNGRVLSEFTFPSSMRRFAGTITVNVSLGLVVAASRDSRNYRDGVHFQMAYYSLLSNNFTNFLTEEIESNVTIIRVSAGGDRMVTKNWKTGELKIYDMAELFSYRKLKDYLASQLFVEDCLELGIFLNLRKGGIEAIMQSDTPLRDLLLALEEKGVIHPSNVNRLSQAFTELKMNPCHHVTNIYQKTRMQVTLYSRFLASLSTHLTSTLVGDLSDYLNISNEKKINITSNQNPGLALLLVLDEIGVIGQYAVEALEQPFTELRLVQALAKIYEYQSILKKEGNQMQKETNDDKKLHLVKCLQRKIRIWHEAMSPVPWKKSCEWKSTELFIGSGLILVDTNRNQSLQDIDEKCKLEYTDIFNHELLKSEYRIIVEGEPGSGKTMLASQLAYDWAQGKISDIDILILLPLRLVEKKTLIQALYELYTPQDRALSLADIQSVITDEGNNCCFLLDGLEEYNGGRDASEVTKVMKKSKYPNCKVVLTTRSNYAQGLPSCPTLKIGKFGKEQRNSYIGKVFRDDKDKQMKVQKTIEDNPFILDLCRVPVLFVLTIHNIESLERTEKVARITPFVKNIIEMLCPSMSSEFKANSSIPDKQISGKLSLAEIAYNGLCRGFQQLSWQKNFIEMNVSNSENWLDSGILTVVDSNAALVDTSDQNRTLSDSYWSSKSNTSLSGAAATSATCQNTEDIVSLNEDKKKPWFQSTATKTFLGQAGSKMGSKKAYDTGFLAKHISLEVKFLHKIVQEWFAAKQFALMMSVIQTAKEQRKFANERLLWVDPADLHYVLRFSCALHPHCFHFIGEHLVERYCSENNIIPEFIMDCLFFCFAESGGDIGPDVIGVIVKMCKQDIRVHSGDGRLLHQAKVSLLEMASDSGISISKVYLDDVIVSVKNDVLTLNSVATLKVLDTLTAIEVSRWDQRLEEVDYCNIVKYISKCSLLEEAYLKFPSQPPSLDKSTLLYLKMNDVKVTWNIGSRVTQKLDVSTGTWMLSDGVQLFSTEQNPSHTLKTQQLISYEGGIIAVPKTGVTLEIPSNAFLEENKHCNIEIRLLDNSNIEGNVTSLSSNSTVAVELLPNRLKLRQPAVLTLPHCLKLKNGTTYGAEVFISHHEQNDKPEWKRQHPSTYQLNEKACVITLNEFCWVKYEIDDRIIEAKKLQVYTASKKISTNAKIVKLEVGYYPDLDSAGKLLKMNRNWEVAEQKPFLFLKDGRLPLQIQFNEVVPPVWEYCTPHDNPKVISFRKIASSTESSCPFILKRHNEGPSYCVFKIFQSKEYIELTSPLQVEEAGDTREDVGAEKSQFKPLCQVPSNMGSFEEPRGAVGETVLTNRTCNAAEDIYGAVQHGTCEDRIQVGPSQCGLLQLHHTELTQNFYWNSESDKFPITFDDDNVEGQGLSLSYSTLNKIAMKLDQEDPLGHDWKELADELGFSMEEILIIERRGKPTITVILSALKRDTLTCPSQLKKILQKIHRFDAAALIPD